MTPSCARRPKFAAAMAGAALLFALVLAAPPASGKEPSAGCLALDDLRLRGRKSIEIIAGHRRRGSALAAYQVLRTTVASMVHDAAAARCGAVERTLAAALKRSARASTARDAAAELELGLDAVESLALDGHLRYQGGPPKFVPVDEAALYGQDCPDLFPLTVRLEGPAPSLPARVQLVLADLRAHPRCGPVRRLLEAASPGHLAHAVDSIRLDEPDEVSTAEDLELTGRCPELPLVMEALAAAIAIGAPQYNAGDARACQTTYEAAAHAVTVELVAADRCPAVRAHLAVGLAHAAAAGSAKEAAWALRFSFDAVLSGGGGRAAP